MATDPLSPSNGKTDAVPSDHQSASSRSPESLPDSRRSRNKAPPQPHVYTSLHDLLEFPCKCPLCTYVRQPREPGGRLPEPGPEFPSGGIVTRLALAMLLPLPEPPRRFRSKRLMLRRFLRGLGNPANASLEFLNRHVVAAISRAFEWLLEAIQATEEEKEDALPCGRLPFVTC
ncbi:hypothetical protein ACJRO7_013006 [Eucalyptus globulus]|uniref:Uncharacterized protein n=1 Tax=Eucalyptus globulus TaxID=34317 RepID=A0ABD3LLG3_EUCGL